ncbi:S1C family serine protease [Cnuibacter sp. UC19_7]|uniref:S1C family serine protease n=1 Tax=Cnuibacter sp. UC19_7 TaxID=3350166 RepID=UPI00366C9F92
MAGGLALAAIVGTSGYALGSSLGTPAAAAVDSHVSGGSTSTDGGASGQGSSPYLLIPGQGDYGQQYGSGAGGGTDTSTDAVAATAAQKKGVVTIVSQLGYQSAESAGTGIILTSDGLILTNNHVVEGSTATQVTDETTGKTYTATVVGTDKTHDIAVLQLQNASGLTTASLETSGSAAVGDAVTAVGNAGGTGDLVAASGTVAALDQTITTQSEAGVTGETLTGLIQVDADIVSGDSGGPLLDAQGDVVGIDTAASSGSTDITGFAIPISTALDIASQIEAGTETDTIEIGYPGFLGVEVAQAPTGSASGSRTGRGSSSSASGSTASGATVGGVIAGTPADEVGLVAGDVITAVNGTAVASADDLTAKIGQMEPGEVVTLTWTTASGASQTAAVTLTQGPAA